MNNFKKWSYFFSLPIILSFNFILLPVKSDNDKEEKKYDEYELLLKDIKAKALFKGQVFQACAAYIKYGYITNAEKITLVENSRKLLYEMHRNPKVMEREVLSYFKKLSPDCFPELQ